MNKSEELIELVESVGEEVIYASHQEVISIVNSIEIDYHDSLERLKDA